MAKIQEVSPEESGSTSQPLEQENKTVFNAIKESKRILTQELKEMQNNLDETSKALGEATSCRDSCLIALQTKTDELEKLHGPLMTENELSKQTEYVNNEVHNNLLKSFSKLEKYSISLELALQQCKEQMKNNSVCKENGSNVFRKEREQYHEIQDLKAQMQDKNIAISELKKLIENCKGKSVETQFDKPSVVRQPNAQRIPKPSVLGKPTPFSNSPKMRRKSQSVVAKIFDIYETSPRMVSQKMRASAENNTSGPVPQCLVLHQMTSDHNRSELGIQDHSNEQSSSKLVPKVVP
ncbi:hypothetical protein Tco_0631520 [Tanacetum coccineum]